MVNDESECCFERLNTVFASTSLGFKVLRERDNRMANRFKNGKSFKVRGEEGGGDCDWAAADMTMID